MTHKLRRFFFSGGPKGRVGVLVLASILAGCATAAPTTQPLTEDQKQDQALEHPDEYKLNMHHDISGGGIGESRGLGTDIDHVLNP
jgi:hypothetical protein